MGPHKGVELHPITWLVKMDELVTIRAKIRLLRAENGGREREAWSGYRPTVHFGELYASGSIELLDRDVIKPGDECEVYITLLDRAYVQDLLVPGKTFDLTEGQRKIGEGEVIYIRAE